MSESTLVSSTSPQLPEPPGPTPTPRGEPTQISPPGEESTAQPAGDRLQLSFETLERIVASRVQTVVGRALPELGLAADDPAVQDRPAPRDSLQALIASLRGAFADGGRPGARGRLRAAANRLDQNFRALTKFLERTGALDKETAKEIRALYRQTRGDLQSVVRDLPDDGEDEARASVVAVAASREAAVSESRSFSIEVRTQEGDVATLQLQRSDSASYSGQIVAVDGTLTRSESVEINRQSSLNYTVVGDLNEEERGAIDELLENVDGVAERFFDGDVQAAFEYSLEFGFDETEIAGFSLNLSRSVEYYAASSYQVVQALGSDEGQATLAPPAEEDRQAAGDLVTGLRELTTEPRLNFLFADAGNLVKQAFRGAIGTDPRLDPADDPTRALIERLLDAV